MSRKLTYKEVKYFIEVESNSNYKLLSTEYENSSKKLNIQCDKGHIYKVSLSVFKKGHRCPFCSRNAKLSYEFVKSSIESIGYILLSKEYKNSSSKLIMVCENNHKFFMSWNDIQQGARCPSCLGLHRRRSHKEYCEEVFNLVGNEYEVLSEFINTSTCIKMKHNVCGFIWDIVPSSFLSGTRCPQCQHSGHKKTTEEFKKEIYQIVKDEYLVLGEYEGADKKILIQHTLCGNKYETTPHNFLNGRRCSKCFGGISYTHETFLDIVKNTYGGQFEIIDNYINSKSKIKVKHNTEDCGNTFEIRASYVLNKKIKCPHCQKQIDSYGEIRIQKYLNDNNLLYKKQYRIDDCKNIRKLPFDFAVFNQRQQIICLIEYQGEQHYNIISNWGGVNKLEYQQKNDQIKYEYCIKNNLNFICIPYWDFNNIETILNNELYIRAGVPA